MKLGPRLTLMGIANISAMTLVMMIVVSSQTAGLIRSTGGELHKLIDNDLKHICEGAHNTVKCQDESLRVTVANNLNVAGRVLGDDWQIQSGATKAWKATNQFTKETAEATLPVMMVHGTALTINNDPDKPSPVVDEVQRMVGGVATIFQRINEDGDMLRVSTNVLTKAGKRAVGTYIPAVNPDGKPNPVVSALLEGKTYHGMAFVVDTWYVSAYEPLKDSAGKVVGAIFVGVKQETVASLRESLTATEIGSSGYVWVLGGKGDQKGKYIVSKDGKRDGEIILEAKDPSGNRVIAKMIDKALTLKPGEVYTYRYMWQNTGDKAPRWKVAAIMYYEPWDWVIGASTNEDEFDKLANQVRSSGRGMLATTLVVCLFACAISGFVFRSFATGLASRLRLLTHTANALAQGDINQADQLVNKDESS